VQVLTDVCTGQFNDEHSKDNIYGVAMLGDTPRLRVGKIANSQGIEGP